MKTRALFLSDIHISSPDDPKYALFLRLLQDCAARTRPEHLFLVGDIFDLWIADRPYFTERYAQAITALRALIASGVQVHYFEGNHDLDLDVFWRRDLGAHVYDEAAPFELGGLKLRVEHGDQMDPEDRGYRFLRWFLRTPFMRGLGRHLPNRLVAWIGERASRASRDYTSNVKTTSDERARQKLREHAERVHRHQPFDVLITGHTHVREDAQLTPPTSARVINLGTWLREPLLLELKSSGELTLRPVNGFLHSAE